MTLPEVPNSPTPKALEKDELADILQDMADRVRCGDCWEGRIEFYFGEPMFSDSTQYSALGAYRVGNLEGQGGMRIIEG